MKDILKDAKDGITISASDAVARIVELVDSRDENISLAASKHILKLLGFEPSANVNVTGSLAQTLSITSEHAERIVAIAKS